MLVPGPPKAPLTLQLPRVRGEPNPRREVWECVQERGCDDMADGGRLGSFGNAPPGIAVSGRRGGAPAAAR